MPDPRIESYARLLVERCIDVRPGTQVMIASSPLARPLVEAVVRLIAERGAYALTRLNFSSISHSWALHAPLELLGELSPIDRYAFENVDALISIGAPDNTREGTILPPERTTLLSQAQQVVSKRIVSLQFPWVGCQFPTSALAQDAGMALSVYEDFLYNACLQDWDAVGASMRARADRFDAASEVRIVGDGTDLTLSIRDRKGQVDDGHLNMPGGEFFYSPVEDSAEGVVTFSEFPAVYGSNEASGVRLVFKAGEVVEASATQNDAFLQSMLNVDAGARRLGELGIGCNPGIDRHMRNTLFDEKINGTIHLAIGRGFPFIGGVNESGIHWDMVKDLRTQGQIWLDGELVQENGAWLI